MKSYFITASGTDIGKTYFTNLLAQSARKKDANVRVVKPVISGFAIDDVSEEDSDSHILLKAQGLEITPQNINNISPWRFKAPLSPHMAADVEGKPQIGFGELIGWCQQEHYAAQQQGNEMFLIEGVGGVMSPIDWQYTVLDWIKELNMPVIMVLGSYLGAISHGLTAINTLIQNHIDIHAIIVNDHSADGVDIGQTFRSFKEFLPGSFENRIFFMPDKPKIIPTQDDKLLLNLLDHLINKS